MPVRTALLFSGTSAPAGSVHDVYTCPADHTAILKDIEVSWVSGTVGRCVVIAVSGSASVILIDAPIGPTAPIRGDRWVVLEPGHKLQFYSEGGVAQCWLSGTELAGVAP